MRKYWILFADLDGTLIRTASGRTFAEDCTDFRIRKDVLDRIKVMGLRYLVIVTNQGGIPKFISQKDFDAKLSGIAHFIQSYLNGSVSCGSDDVLIECRYCASMDVNHPLRKPNPGMLQGFMDETLKSAPEWLRDKGCMLMIGDASGKEGQFSDSDKKCAESFGIEYMDVEDFINR